MSKIGGNGVNQKGKKYLTTEKCQKKKKERKRDEIRNLQKELRNSKENSNEKKVLEGTKNGEDFGTEQKLK